MLGLSCMLKLSMKVMSQCILNICNYPVKFVNAKCVFIKHTNYIFLKLHYQILSHNATHYLFLYCFWTHRKKKKKKIT